MNFLVFLQICFLWVFQVDIYDTKSIESQIKSLIFGFLLYPSFFLQKKSDVTRKPFPWVYLNINSPTNYYVFITTLQDHDMSVEMFNQHAAISELQQTEELLHEQHKTVIEFLNQYSPQIVELYRMTNNVEYDQDGKSQLRKNVFDLLPTKNCTQRNRKFDINCFKLLTHFHMFISSLILTFTLIIFEMFARNLQ